MNATRLDAGHVRNPTQVTYTAFPTDRYKSCRSDDEMSGNRRAAQVEN
jgi:hypothetical protein